MNKPFGAREHCALDYVFVTALLAAPRLFDLRDSARTVCYAFGVTAGVLTALTNQPFALQKIVPFRIHGKVDTPFVPTLLLLPWAVGAFRQPSARRFFGAFFVVVLANYLLTDYESNRD